MENKLACLDENNKVVNIVIASDNFNQDKQNLISSYGYNDVIFCDSEILFEVGNVYENGNFVESQEQIDAKQEGLIRLQQEEQQRAARQALLDRLGITEEEAKLLLS